MVLAENRFETLNGLWESVVRLTRDNAWHRGYRKHVPPSPKTGASDLQCIINFKKVLQGEVAVQVKVTGKESLLTIFIIVTPSHQVFIP